ncbi:MAG: hypothetical protein Q4P84_08625 [Elusimicrobiales bacterium]|nr:hypothetical protein [Elusimicrobiales bacterium]
MKVYIYNGRIVATEAEGLESALVNGPLLDVYFQERYLLARNHLLDRDVALPDDLSPLDFLERYDRSTFDAIGRVALGWIVAHPEDYGIMVEDMSSILIAPWMIMERRR